MAVVQRAVYRPRRPRESPLYRLVEDLCDTLVGVHEERFEPQYGRLRHVARRALERFLDCGIPDHGFARVVCERCKAEFLVAFSCKTRYLCPSCHAKRLEIWAASRFWHRGRCGDRSRARAAVKNTGGVDSRQVENFSKPIQRFPARSTVPEFGVSDGPDVNGRPNRQILLR